MVHPLSAYAAVNGTVSYSLYSTDQGWLTWNSTSSNQIAWGRPLVAVQRLDRGSQEHRFGSNAILCWRLGYNDPLSVN